MSEPRKTPVASPRKVRIGVVVSTKMMKTIVVQVDRLVRHPLYQRVVKRSSRFKVHDETNRAKVGDWVKIMETRPLSKEKCWRLVDILRQGSTAEKVPGGEAEPLDQPRASAP